VQEGVAVSGGQVSVEGPKGRLSLRPHADVQVKWDEGAKAVVCSIDEQRPDAEELYAQWGTTRALIASMVEGVTKGYEKKMEVVGVGWTAAVQGKNLKLVVGYANPILMPIPEGVTVTVEKQFVTITGADKQKVGQFASQMRAQRKPEPYNGKGVKYVDEVIKKKQGKQFGAGATGA